MNVQFVFPPPSVEKRKVFFIDSGSLHRFVKNNQCSVQAEIHHLTAASIVHNAVLPDEMLFLSNERAWPACFCTTVAFTYWSFSHGHVWALFLGSVGRQPGTGLHQPGSLLVLQVLILNEYTFMTCVLYSHVDVFLCPWAPVLNFENSSAFSGLRWMWNGDRLVTSPHF